MRALALIALLALSACHAPQRVVRPDGSDALAARRAELGARERWSFEGRVAVSDGKDSGSARITWAQDGERYAITLRAPVSGETWRLAGDASGCRLEGLRPEPIVGPDPQELLRRELGWNLPVRALAAWARGVSGDATAAEIVLDEGGLPSRLREQGWQVSYRDWHRDRTPALPKRIEADRPPHQVRLAIASWSDGD